MSVSKFTQTLIISILISIGLALFFIWGLEYKLGNFFYSGLFIYALCLSLFPAIAVIFAFLMMDIFRPFYFQLRGLKLEAIDAKVLTPRYDEFCERNQLKVKPLIFLANTAFPFSIGIHRGKSMIIVPKYLLDFKEDERESVIVHELWHIRNDSEAAYLWLFGKTSAFFLWFSSLFVISTILFEYFVLGWWTVDTYLFVGNLPWVIFVALAFPFSFSRIVTIIRPWMGFPSYMHPERREQIADWCGSLITGKPSLMIQTINKAEGKATIQKILGEASLSKIGFVTPNFRKKKKTSSIGDRKESLLILDKVLNTQVTLRWKKPPTSWSDRFYIDFLVFASRIAYGTTFVAITKDTRNKLIEYMWSNRANFNLRISTKETSASMEDTALVFFLLLSQEVISLD